MNKKLILFICVSMAQQISCGEFQTKKVLHPMLEKQQVATMVADTLDVCANRSQPRPNPFKSSLEDDCLSPELVHYLNSHDFEFLWQDFLKMQGEILGKEDSDPETDLMTTDIDLLTDETDLMTSETDIMSEEDSDTPNEPVQKKLKAELSSPMPVVVQLIQPTRGVYTIPVPIQRKSDKKYTCDQCTFKGTQIGVKQHKGKMHKSGNQKSSNSDVYTCPYCFAYLTDLTKEGYVNHLTQNHEESDSEFSSTSQSWSSEDSEDISSEFDYSDQIEE